MTLLNAGLYFSFQPDKLTVCSCHVTYAFESESTLYSCLNVKELLARTSLAKWLSVRLRTKWFWVRVQLQSLHPVQDCENFQLPIKMQLSQKRKSFSQFCVQFRKST